MDAKVIREGLVAVLVEIQTDSGFKSPDITDDLRPADALPEFDSLIWPVAAAMLAERLGITIPDNENLFVSPDGRHRRTIREIVVRVEELTAK